MFKNKIVYSNSNYIKFLKILFWSIFNLVLSPLILLLCIINPVFRIQFVKIRDDRIGHLAANTETFLRRLKLGIIKKKGALYIGIASTKPCNKQLLKMFKRKMTIIQLPKPLSEVAFSEKSLLVKSGFGMHLPFNSNEYYEFTYGKPNIKFTSAEEKKGKELLKKIGLMNKDWFICFHARDQKYLAKHFSSVNYSYHNYRDWDINNALKAARYIVSKGGFAMRMGAVVEKKLPKSKNQRIIDYASYYRSDFGDIYLSAKCKFFFGNGSGISQVAQIFNVPVVWVNLLPFTYPPWRKGDLFIPKKLWSIEKKRYLTFRELLEIGASDFHRSSDYEKAKLKIVDNTPEEIYDLVVEMNQKLDGKFKYTKEDEELQKGFRSLFKTNSHCYGFPSRIGARFLKKNKFLLGQ